MSANVARFVRERPVLSALAALSVAAIWAGVVQTMGVVL